MWTPIKSLLVVLMTVCMVAGCTDDEQPGKTADGVSPYDREDREPSIFGRNSQITREVATGKLNDNIKWDTPTADGPTDNLDISNTTAADGRTLTNATNRSVFGATTPAGSNKASKAALHKADGKSTVAKGTSIHWGDQENAVARAQKELSRRGYQITVNGKLDTQTRNAVLRFQKANGLEQTGKLTETTLNALNVIDTEDGRAPASVE